MGALIELIELKCGKILSGILLFIASLFIITGTAISWHVLRTTDVRATCMHMCHCISSSQSCRLWVEPRAVSSSTSPSALPLRCLLHGPSGWLAARTRRVCWDVYV